MENIKNELRVEERQHSLSWHQNQVKKTYEALIDKCKEEKKWDNNFHIIPFPGREEYTPLYQYYLDAGYSYSDIFADTYCDSIGKEGFYADVDSKVMVVADDPKRVFNLSRLEFLKTLNMVDALVTRICDYNIDRSVFKFGFDTSRAREAFIWLMYTSNPSEMVDVQDMNRLRTFYKIQINRNKKGQGKYYDHANIEKEYNEVRNSLERIGHQRNRWRKNKIDALKKFKENMQTLINDVFDVYDILSEYRDYLVDTENRTIGNKEIYSLQGAVVMANAIKRVFLERFSSYSKIPELMLGHSEMSGVQFTRSDISGSNFINSNFKYARLDNAVASNCDFSICNFTKCDAKGATLNNCTFNYSNMSGMDLSGATLKNTLLDAVIFRDNQLDESFEYAEALLYNNNKWIAAYDMRAKELNEAENRTSVLHPQEECEQIFTKMYNSLTKDGDDCVLWDMTCANEDDVYPHILSASETGEITEDGKTVFDNVFYEVQGRLQELVTECESKVISKELLATLREAEIAEDPANRQNRFRDFGSVCFEPTLLRGANIIDSSLPQIDLSHIDMRNASFEKSDMSGAIGYYANAETAYFGDANLNGGEFFRCNFNDTNFSRANCINATFIDCGLHAVNMSNALSVGVTFVNTKRNKPFLADLLTKISKNDDYNSFFENLSENICDSEYLSDEAIDMSDSNWTDAMATKSKFIGLKMDRSYFNHTDLSNFMIFNCAVRWSTFENADSSYGLMLGTSFHQSIFSRATLSQSHIFASEFSGCRMTGTVLIGARCDKVIFYDNDMRNANFSRCLFKNCVFRGCDFSKLNIAKSKFVHCVFYDVDFNDCIGLNSAYFEECIFDNIASFKSVSGSNSLDETAEIMSLNSNNASDNVKVESVSRSKSKHNLYTTTTSGMRASK